MTEPTLKPGTRCECRDSDPAHVANAQHNADDYCGNDAVRMVTVRVFKDEGHGENWNDTTEAREVPMCEPCAAFHESKGTRP